MTSYIKDEGLMEYNAIWMNHMQTTGSLKHPHPDGVNQASGSLYARADDEALNQLIFPVPDDVVDPAQQHAIRQEQLTKLTKEVRRHWMYPLFELVLNHIGLDEGKDSPLKLKLLEEGKKRNLNLLLPGVNERWPDIQGLDYYKEDSKKHGLTTYPKDLDPQKIDAIFEILWEPLIRRYIQNYGFMGMRVDELTHVPVPVQQRAIRLVQKLVRETYNTDAIIVVELMVSNPEAYLPALSACGLTHCMNPYSYFWGFNKEGGYHNDPSQSPFLRQNKQLAAAVQAPPRHLSSLDELIILNGDLDRTTKHQKNTIYIFKQDGIYYFALNEYETDSCFGKAPIYPIDALGIHSLENDIIAYNQLTEIRQNAGRDFGRLQELYKKEKAKYTERLNASTAEQEEQVSLDGLQKKKEFGDDLDKEFDKNKAIFLKGQNTIRINQNAILENISTLLHDSKELQTLFSRPSSSMPQGGLIGVVGKHDVGTLKAKVMLDIAYNRALNNAGENQEAITQIEAKYTQCKQAIIRGIRNTDQLIEQLQLQFALSALDKKHLFLELNMRMREKIFIQSMMCTGG